MAEAGTVTAPALRSIRPDTPPASGPPTSIAASAVNALHVKIANHPETGRGVIFSIIPAGDTVGAAEGHPTTSIATDIAAAPPSSAGALRRWLLRPSRWSATAPSSPADYVPAEGDALVIVVTEPPSSVVVLELRTAWAG